MARLFMGVVALLALLGGSSMANAASPRDMLTTAAFTAREKTAALGQIAAAQTAAEAKLKADPDDREAILVRAMAVGYRGKIKRSKSDAVEARLAFESLAKSDPRDPQAQMVLAGWHLDAVDDLGKMLAGAVLGAKSATGLAALDRAVSLSANSNATYPGFASLMRIRLDPGDVARAKALALAATQAPVVTPLDRVMQRSAALVLAPLNAGDGKAAAALAAKLLPFARLKG